MLLEPPHPHVPAGPRPSGLAAARPALAAGAAIVALTSTGDVLLLAALLAVVAADVAPGAVAVVAGLSVLARWGTSSLSALAGAQAVAGAAGWTGPPLLVASSWCAAAALVAAAPRHRAGAVAFGLLAADLAAGPAVVRSLATTNLDHLLVRAAAGVVGVVAALVTRRSAPAGRTGAACVLAAAGAVLAVVA